MEYKLGQPQTAQDKGRVGYISSIKLGRANQLELLLHTSSESSIYYACNRVRLISRISGSLYGRSWEVQYTVLSGPQQHRTTIEHHTTLRMEVVSRLVSNDLKYLTSIKNALHKLYGVSGKELV